MGESEISESQIATALRLRRLRELVAENQQLKKLVAGLSLDDARTKIEAWRREDDGCRPRRSLADPPPDPFAEGYYAETADPPLTTGEPQGGSQIV